MRDSRRLKRMAKAGSQRNASLNLVSLMDVFTILVFFLLVNSSSSDVLEPPKQIKLPDSIVEAKPRETVTVMITRENVLVQGRPVVSLEELVSIKEPVIESIREELILQRQRVIGMSTKVVSESTEVTLLADSAIPFKYIKKVMSSCTSAGYGKISLAVLQKASQI